MSGISAVGCHLPRFRLSSEAVAEAWGRYEGSGIDAKRVPAADEDTLTSALAAAESALGRGSVDADGLSAITLATTTPPLEEGELLPRLVRMLGAPKTATTRTFTQSMHAGASALDTALEADGPAIAIAADAPRGDPADSDHSFGAGAAAFLVEDSAPVTRLDTANFSDELPGVRYRERGESAVASLNITTYEREGVRRCVTEAVSRLDGDVANVDAAAVYQPDAKFPARATAELPLDREAVTRGTVVDRIGDAGAAGVPLGLMAALSSVDGDSQSLAVFFGGGGSATAMLFEGGVDGAPLANLGGESISYPEYLRKRGYVGTTEVAGGGAHVSLPSWERSIDQRYRLAAGRCPECGALAFPPEGTCPNCYQDVAFERVELPRVGTVRAVTVIGQGGAPPEFAEQQRRDGEYGVAIVELITGDESVTLPAQLTDVDPETVEVGDDVAAVVRKIYTQEGVPRYGVKFGPTEA